MKLKYTLGALVAAFALAGCGFGYPTVRRFSVGLNVNF